MVRLSAEGILPATVRYQYNCFRRGLFNQVFGRTRYNRAQAISGSTATAKQTG